MRQRVPQNAQQDKHTLSVGEGCCWVFGISIIGTVNEMKQNRGKGDQHEHRTVLCKRKMMCVFFYDALDVVSSKLRFEGGGARLKGTHKFVRFDRFFWRVGELRIILHIDLKRQAKYKPNDAPKGGVRNVKVCEN